MQAFPRKEKATWEGTRGVYARRIRVQEIPSNAITDTLAEWLMKHGPPLLPQVGSDVL